MAYESTVKIVGVTALLQHRYRFSDERFQDEVEKSATRKSGRQDYSQEWKTALYADKDGNIYEPASHIEGAIVRAAGNFQITGRSKKTYRELVKGAVFVSPDAIPLGKKEPDFIHKARVIVNRAAVERLRPGFRVWELSFTIQVLDEQLGKDVLREILQHAGQYYGIGDFRPRFGRFRVVSFE